jgi:hypothetical protein
MCPSFIITSYIMGDNNIAKYEGVYVVTNQVRVEGPKEVFDLRFVDRNANWGFSSYDQEYRELFKMLLSKYVPLQDIGSEKFQYRIPQVPISSDKMRSAAQKLKEELKSTEVPNDPSLSRVKELLSDVIQDIDYQLKKTG